MGGLWGSFDSSIGGIVGQAEPGATYNFDNVTINCRIDAYNDCTASYDYYNYYNYYMCGMIIGRCEETTIIDGKNCPDLSKYNLSFNNGKHPMKCIIRMYLGVYISRSRNATNSCTELNPKQSSGVVRFNETACFQDFYV